MRTRPLRMRRITWTVSRGSKAITFLESPTRFAYSLCNLGGSTMKVIKVICENNARPCVKRHMSFYACAKSRDLLKVPEMPYCSRSRRRRFTVLDFKSEHIVSFTAIFSNICTAHAQKRLLMNFRCKFRQCRSIRRPRFPIRVQNFADLATFSVDFCILYAECPPYFYFRFVWPTDLESISHALTRTTIIPTKFEVYMNIHCRFIAFLSADTSRDLVALTFLTLNSSHTWRVTWPTLPPSLKTLRPTPTCECVIQILQLQVFFTGQEAQLSPRDRAMHRVS